MNTNNNLLIFASYDMKAKMWSKPMTAGSTGLMTRSWQDIANDKNHPVGQHPEDYCLYQIGEYNDNTGELIPLKAHVSLGQASGYVKENVPMPAVDPRMVNKKNVENT